MEMDGQNEKLAVRFGVLVPWDELQGVLLNEISSTDNVQSLESVLGQLLSLSDAQICCFLCSKEGLAMIKSNVVAENTEIRLTFIQYLGKMIIRGWMCLHDNIDLEGLIRVESRAEARRFREDFFDAAVELFKNFASGCIGTAPSADPGQTLEDDYSSMVVYCDVISTLLNCYNEAYSQLDSWIDALVGVRGSGSAQVQRRSQESLQQLQLNLVPLLRPALNIIFSDPYLLIARSRAHPSYSNSAVSVVSGFMQLLLNQVGSGTSSLVLLDLSTSKSYLPMFAAGKDVDITLQSRSGDTPVSVVQYASHWVDNIPRFIMATSVHPTEMFTAVRDVIGLTQHELMRKCREQVSTTVLNQLLFLLESEHAADIACDTNSSPKSVSQELIAMTLLTLRYLPAAPAGTVSEAGTLSPEDTVFAYPYIARLLKIVLHLNDRIVETRFFAELAVLVVNSSLTDNITTLAALAAASADSTDAANSVRFDISISALGTLLRNTPMANQPNSRLVTALLHTLHKSIELNLSVLSEFIPSDEKVIAVTEGTDLLELVDEVAVSSSSKVIESSSSNAAHPWSLYHHELFISKSKLFRLKLQRLAGDRASSSDLSPSDLKTELSALSEYLMRQLQAVIFIVKLCGDSCLRWSVDGDAGDSVPQTFTSLLEIAGTVLVTGSPSIDRSSTSSEKSSALTVCGRVRQHLVDSYYEQSVRLLSHAFSVSVDKLLEALVGGSNSISTSVLCIQPHMVRFATLAAATLPAMRAITGSDDVLHSLLSYLKLLLHLAERRRALFHSALHTKAQDGLLGGGLTVTSAYSCAEHDSLCLALQLHALELIARVASDAAEDDSVRGACINLVADLRAQHLAASDVTKNPNKHESATVSTSEVLSEGIDRALRQLGATHVIDRSTAHHNRDSAESDVSVERVLNTDICHLYIDGSASHSTAVTPAHGTQLTASVKNGIIPHSAGSSLMDLVSDSTNNHSAHTTTKRENHLVKTHFSSSSWRLHDTATFDTTAFSRIYGLFSSAKSHTDKAHVCAADVLALVDDVLYSHIRNSQPTTGSSAASHTVTSDVTATPEDSRNESHQHNNSSLSPVDWTVALCGPKELHWTQVSGSSDVLTVLASIDFDVLERRVSVATRVFNSSGFKVPTFTLHLMVQPSGGCASSSGAQSAELDGSSIFQSSGMEYFLSDSYVERTFSFPVTAFSPLQVTLRVVYPDLLYDEDENLFEIPPEVSSGSTAHGARAKRQPFTTAISHSFFGGYGNVGTNGDANSNKYTALVDCAPLVIPVSALLLPYGAGVFSSLHYWSLLGHKATRSCEAAHEGLPLAVFQAMWRRLSSTHPQYVVKVAGVVAACSSENSSSSSVFLSERVAQTIRSAVVGAVNSAGTSGLYPLGMDGKVDVRAEGRDVLAPFLSGAASEASNVASGGSEPFVAWGLQTLWGAEVACKLTVSTPINVNNITSSRNNNSNHNSSSSAALSTVRPVLRRSISLVDDAFGAGPGEEQEEQRGGDGWSGSLEIRCSDVATLGAIQRDLSQFITAISGDSFELQSC